MLSRDEPNKESMRLRLEEWEVTIQTITNECNHKKKKTTAILKDWRAKLEKEPTLLRPFQIDEIMRAVSGKLNTTRQMNGFGKSQH